MKPINHSCPDMPCQGMSAANTVVENGGRVVLLVESSDFIVNLSQKLSYSPFFVDGPLFFWVRLPFLDNSIVQLARSYRVVLIARELRTSRLFAVATAPRQPPELMEQAR